MGYAARRERIGMGIAGIDHIGLTVADVDRSTRRYEDVLGFTTVGRHQEVGEGGLRKMVFMTCAGLATAFGFVSHQSSAGAAFDETVAGLDHLSFRLADIEELDDWAQRLQHWKVEYSQPADSTLRPGAKVLVFRDPDNIQLELYALPT
jgi:catechol 2,3-dioxygenase-like lactoylglutathione lyase family enzyme